ncbi:MAG: glycosyltransferase [Candidatus Aenigmatarchaeota archaeon]
MKISVVVCSVGRETLFDCLQSLKSQNYEEYETIVVSFERSIEEKVKDYGARFIFSPRANASFQKNLGILESRGELICFIDDDAIAEPNWIKTLSESFTEDQIACVGGKIKLIIEGEIPDRLKSLDENIFKGFLGETLLGDEKKEIEEPLLWGSNICFRKKIFDEVGYFDEKIGRTPNLMLCNEDIEIQERILKKGFKIIYEPSALVWHKVTKERLTMDYFLKRSFWQGYSDVLAARRNENVKKFVANIKNPFWNFLIKKKMFENMFESFIVEDLNKKIFNYQRIGRIVGFLELTRGV